MESTTAVAIQSAPHIDRLADCWKFSIDRSRPLYAEFTTSMGRTYFVRITALRHDRERLNVSFTGELMRTKTGRVTTSAIKDDHRYVAGTVIYALHRRATIYLGSEPLDFPPQ